METILSELTISPEGKLFSPTGELKQHTAKSGYLVVNYRGGTHYVHRLVAAAYHPNPENKRVVAHWDGDKTNNHIDNLRWATDKENSDDKVRHGRTNRGTRNGQAKLSSEDVRRIRQCRSEGQSVHEVAEAFGVSTWTIYDACNPNRTWQHMSEEEEKENH